MSEVGPDTYRVGPGNILQFQPLNQFTALHGNPKFHHRVHRKPSLDQHSFSKPPYNAQKPIYFLLRTNAKLWIQFRPAMPRHPKYINFAPSPA